MTRTMTALNLLNFTYDMLRYSSVLFIAIASIITTTVQSRPKDILYLIC